MVDRSPAAEIRILGPLGVTGPPAAALGGPRQRSLLVLLAVNLGCPISRDRIIDAIWSDPPPSAVSTIQGYVSHLRRAFEGHPVGIDFSGGAYVLVGDGRLVDASRFEAATAKASLLLRSDRERDVRDALTTAEAALALWRGPALDGFLDAPFARPEATRLEQRRIEAGALRARALLELGRSADAIGALEPLVEEQPYDEELGRLLMLALYGAGRQNDALGVFRRMRTRLRTELGVDPGPALTAAERQILTQDSRLRRLVPPPGAGLPRSRPRTPGMARGTSRSPWPVYATTFVGRRTELRRLAELVVRNRAVTVTGPGGVGKTRLALAVVDRLAGRVRSDQAAFVDVARVGEAQSLLAAVALAVSAYTIAPDPDAIAAALRGRAVLLILDNCEHLVAACGRLTSELTDRTEGTRIVVTSREPLDVAGEVVWEIPPLRLPRSGEDRAAVLGADAVQLFIERAQPAAIADDLRPSDLQAIIEIVARADGLPLAIELAAAMARAFALGDVRRRLRGSVLLREEIEGAGSGRHRSLEQMIEWSHRLLTPPQRLLFARLGIFRSSFGLTDVESVCCDARIHREEVFTLLGRLIRCSLVVRQPREDDRPYRLLESVRVFAAGRLTADPEASAGAADRHRAHFVPLAEQARAGLDGPEPARWARIVDQIEPDLQAASEECRRRRDQDGIAAIALALSDHWVARYRLAEAEAVLAEAQRSLRDDHPSRVAIALGRSVIANSRDDFAAARVHGTDALQRAERLGDAVGQGYALTRMAEIVRSADNDRPGAAALVDRARRVAEAHGEPRLLVEAARIGALLNWDGGRLIEAEHDAVTWREAARRAHSARAMAEAGIRLAGLAGERGRYAEAQALYEEAARFYATTGDPLESAYIVYGQARVALAQGRVDEAGEQAAAALVRFRRIGDDWGEGITRCILGEADLRRGRLESAGEHLRRSLRVLTERGFADDVAATADLLAQWALVAADLDQAERICRSALDGLGPPPNRRRGPLLRTLGMVALARGDLAAAAGLTADALAECRASASAAAVAAAQTACVAVGRARRR